MKIVIIGGVAGGATAAARLRRLDEKAEIILFEKGAYVSFANCGLPYYIGGEIMSRDALFVSTKETITAKYNVDIRDRTEVIKIDKDNKKVLAKDIETGKTYEENYDKLIISTGSSPFVPDFEGKDFDNVFTLWTIPDTDRIYNFIKNNAPKKAVVVGGGFIGLEMVENLSRRGIAVTLVEKMNQVMPPLDKDMAKLAENHLVAKNVNLMLEKGLVKITSNGKNVVLDDGSTIETDMVILSIGVRPNSSLAKDSGLKLNQRGGIIVDEFGQTSDSDIYAVGDVIEVENYLTRGKTMIPLAGPANKQGRAVCANVLDSYNKEAYKGTMGTSIAKIFDITVASTGLNEKMLNANGKIYKKDYFISLVHPMSQAGYYPGGLPMTIKLIFASNKKILGAQIVGYTGVDKRIDTIATSIHYGGDIYDLSQLELAYAPPYSSAKDPVNFAGFAACNIYEGLSSPMRYEEYLKNTDKYVLIDVREKMEIMAGKIEGSINMPLTTLRETINTLDKNKEYVLQCAVGLRGYIAERIFKQNGFTAFNLLGGYRTYCDITMPTNLSSNSNPCYCSTSNDTNQDKFESEKTEDAPTKIEILNVCGLSCPGPIMQVSKYIDTIKDGEHVKVLSTDPGFARDIKSWCNNTGNTLISQDMQENKFIATIKKGTDVKQSQNTVISNKKEKTMIIFSGDLDKAIASFIIANGAASMGNKVNMFFTFWGLNILRKNEHVLTKKDFISTIFSSMMPQGSQKLGLSKMNFLGIGAKMIRDIMNKHNVPSLEELIQQAKENNIKISACQMSMDLMGIKLEELIDGVEVAGVASMLDDNDNSNMNLFI
ncbi:hypothetical protein HMPREF1143_0852 [Peptoanaerobacter stomatis]|uniref:Rhodanese domain-containing protein n=1 Tax=Peptoanaerobacter stomatis TaxID=796937 RepID=J6HA21_9FIRM|nr:FAD-dependent oxidoreductase [Peptoanaerobacter stomatis]EJU22015.1 hypothetical protein HMPREF1143_0852 [Peptoanaerobacter stomatis]NWO24852.1 FAD-dependent oxidoreductase [Peptostreptococcaceae bacterium oral taxon 081]